jgi:hypothetical protein
MPDFFECMHSARILFEACTFDACELDARQSLAVQLHVPEASAHTVISDAQILFALTELANSSAAESSRHTIVTAATCSSNYEKNACKHAALELTLRAHGYNQHELAQVKHVFARMYNVQVSSAGYVFYIGSRAFACAQRPGLPRTCHSG